MIEIAVCEDSIIDLSEIKAMLNDYKKRNLCEVRFTYFTNAIDLVSSIQSGINYQIVLLDIIMPHLNGVDAARELCQYDKEARIIFISSSKEFAVESYEIGAYYYILKPLEKEQLFYLIDKVRAEIDLDEKQSIVVKSKASIVRISLSQLEFVEVVNRTLFYHLNDGSVIEVSGTFSIIETKLLEYPQFVKVHRSYIVNINFIGHIEKRQLIMASTCIIPVAKSYYTNLKTLYLNYLFQDIVH